MPKQILILQARTLDDPMLRHEQACFVEQTGLPSEHHHFCNLTDHQATYEILDQAEAVMVGGSGAFSVVTGGFDWHEHMLEAMRHIADRKVPMLGSCFGFQALVQALGGTLAKDEAQKEAGTFDISLTPAGKLDSIFGTMPETFLAQLGHNDSVVHLPESFELLAYSERCRTQGIRLKGTPIIATQFHPELSRKRNLERYLHYIENYREPHETAEEAMDRAGRAVKESPQASRLVREFLEHYVLQAEQ